MHVALLTTMYRGESLARPTLLRRALISVVKQVKSPDLILLVVDPEERKNTELDRIREHVFNNLGDISGGLPLEVLINQRGKGQGGSINTGILHLFSHKKWRPSKVWISFLDDDDWWEPNHLSVISSHCLSDFGLISTAFHRHADSQQELILPPKSWDEIFPAALYTNPGIQTSCMTVSLRLALEAGLWDEFGLTSDRDFLIKASFLGASYTPLLTPTVHIDASSDRLDRISSYGSEKKKMSTNLFWAKYNIIATDEEEKLFWRRARDVFGIDIVPRQNLFDTIEDYNHGDYNVELPSKNKRFKGIPYILIGIVADNTVDGLTRVEPLLSDILDFSRSPLVGRTEVVILENQYENAGLDRVIQDFIERGLWCYYIDTNRQIVDAERGFFGNFTRTPGKVSVGSSRRMLQAYMYSIMWEDGIAWILDDDMRLRTTVWVNNHYKIVKYDIASEIIRLMNTNADVVIGNYAYAPPCKAIATFQSQLLDIFFILLSISRGKDTKSILKVLTENAIMMTKKLEDYYYDWSRIHSWHKELPMIVPDRADIYDLLSYLSDKIESLLHGEPLTRPLVYDSDSLAYGLREGMYRGGNTLVLNREVLRILQPEIDNRSDMVWIFNLKRHGYKVYQSHRLITTQSRKVAVFGHQNIINDIKGYAAYQIDADTDRRYAEDLLNERISSIMQSLYRQVGLCKSILNIKLMSNTYDKRIKRISSVIITIQSKAHEIIEYLSEIIDSLSEEHQEQKNIEFIPNILIFPTNLISVDIMKRYIKSLTGNCDNIELLGYGREGFVFKLRNHIVKYFPKLAHNIVKEEKNHESFFINFKKLEALFGSANLVRNGSHVLAIYPYIAITPYKGASAREWVRLMKICKENKIILSNIKPSNLAISKEDGRLIYIDFGASFMEFSEKDWDIMLRRAWIHWRWAGWLSSQNGEKYLMEVKTRAILEEPPESFGWQYLKQVFELPRGEKQLMEFLTNLISYTNPNNLLDFGCGKGKLLSLIDIREGSCTGYDPNMPLTSEKTHCMLTSDLRRVYERSPFDFVVLSRVLCTVDLQEFRNILSTIREIINQKSKIVVAICNPFYIDRGSTIYKDYLLPDNFNIEEPCKWQKITKYDDRPSIVRTEYYLPWRMLKREVIRQGLRIGQILKETQSILIDRLEPTSEYLIFELLPERPAWPVTLAIRASAMEWSHLYHNIIHIIQQLESPRHFSKIIVVLDNKVGDFTRQYQDADYEQSKAALRKLLDEGWIHEYVEVSSFSEHFMTINQRWWGLPITDTHSYDGIPNMISQIIFEVSETPYVLHVDSDILVYREDKTDDYLQTMIDAMENDTTIVCSSISIPHQTDSEWEFYYADKPDTTFRTEVRAGLFHKERVLSLLPLQPSEDKRLIRFYRALDKAINSKKMKVGRRSMKKSFYFHIPNSLKQNAALWYLITDRVENGYIPTMQYGYFDLHFTDLDEVFEEWLAPKRNEEIIVIVLSSNDVQASTLARLRDSLLGQTFNDFGIIHIVNGSSYEYSNRIHHIFRSFENITTITVRKRMNNAYILALSIKYICRNPNSIICIVNANDAFINYRALEIVKSVFDGGADFALGGYLSPSEYIDLRTLSDKIKEHNTHILPPYCFRRHLIEELKINHENYKSEKDDIVDMIDSIMKLSKSVSIITNHIYIHEPLQQKSLNL